MIIVQLQALAYACNFVLVVNTIALFSNFSFLLILILSYILFSIATMTKDIQNITIYEKEISIMWLN